MSATGFTNLERDFALTRRVGAEEHVVICSEEIPAALLEQLKGEAKKQALKVRVLDAPVLFG